MNISFNRPFCFFCSGAQHTLMVAVVWSVAGVELITPKLWLLFSPKLSGEVFPETTDLDLQKDNVNTSRIVLTSYKDTSLFKRILTLVVWNILVPVNDQDSDSSHLQTTIIINSIFKLFFFSLTLIQKIINSMTPLMATFKLFLWTASLYWG